MMQSVNKTQHEKSQAMRRLGTGLIASYLLLFGTQVFAKVQSADSLRESALHYLQTQTQNRDDVDIEINVGRLDPRLKLQACGTPPSAFLAPGAKLQGKLTVGLRCKGPKPWTVYLPAHIKVFANVITTTQPLPRGSVISEADIISIRQELGQLSSGYFTKKEAVIGKVVRQNMPAGKAITPNRVKAPIIVRRGEKVSIIATVGALKVIGKGEALRNAAEGELVSVRNSRSKRIVQGIAVKSGTVLVQM